MQNSKNSEHKMKNQTRKIILFTLLTMSKLYNVAIAQSISGGAEHSIFLCATTTVQTCGNNADGELGNGTLTNDSIPVTSISLTGITSVASGSLHSLFVKSNGSAWACGYNFYGQLGNGSGASSSSPVQITTPYLNAKFSAVAAGRHHSLFLVTYNNLYGGVYACGNNTFGQLGNGTLTDSPNPTVVKFATVNNSTITSVAAGINHSILLSNSGIVYAFGSNLNGQLGDGTTTSKSKAVWIMSVNNIITVGAGGYHSLFVHNSGNVWSTGSNTYGQLGDGTTLSKSTPAQIGSLNGITAVAGGERHSLFLKNDSTVWACGKNDLGQLGDGTTTNKSTPVQVNGLTGIVAIAAGANHSLFLKSDGTVWACGSNSKGQLGDGSTINKLTPVQVSSLCSVTVSAVSVKENLVQDNITIYPNPCNEILYLELTDFHTTQIDYKNTMVEIFNLQGQKLQSISMLSNKTNLQIDNLTSGLYLIKIKSPEGMIVKKIVKN